MHFAPEKEITVEIKSLFRVDFYRILIFLKPIIKFYDVFSGEEIKERNYFHYERILCIQSSIIFIDPD